MREFHHKALHGKEGSNTGNEFTKGFENSRVSFIPDSQLDITSNSFDKRALFSGNASLNQQSAATIVHPDEVESYEALTTIQDKDRTGRSYFDEPPVTVRPLSSRLERLKSVDTTNNIKIVDDNVVGYKSRRKLGQYSVHKRVVETPRGSRYPLKD
jgi:hypothetical protein